MLSDMNWSTVLATLERSAPKASICLIEASTIAMNVPLIRSATKVGNAIALRVCSVIRATFLAARGENSSEAGLDGGLTTDWSLCVGSLSSHLIVIHAWRPDWGEV